MKSPGCQRKIGILFPFRAPLMPSSTKANAKRKQFPFAPFSICLVFVGFLSLGLLPAQEGNKGTLPDPVPVKRLHLPPEDLPQILAQDKAAILKELPLLE